MERVKIISSTKQQFNGINYWKGTSERYYRNAQHKPHTLHRAVWEYYNGEIPKNMVIDHIDRNPSNNQIENLRCVSISENNKNVSESVKEYRIEHIKNIGELSKNWHKSDIGRKWHSEHAKQQYENAKTRIIKCEVCGKVFETKKYGKATMCSGSCQQKKLRRIKKGLPINGDGKFEKICEYCGQKYRTYSSKSRWCCPKCKDRAKYTTSLWSLPSRGRAGNL